MELEPGGPFRMLFRVDMPAAADVPARDCTLDIIGTELVGFNGCGFVVFVMTTRACFAFLFGLDDAGAITVWTTGATAVLFTRFGNPVGIG